MPVPDDPQRAEQEARAAVDALDDTYLTAAEKIKVVPDPDVMFAIADDLSERIQHLSVLVATLRTYAAGCIWDSKRMSLATLADRIGVSTTRAHQLITKVKQRRIEESRP
jgi:hypothetical protein